MSDAPQPPAQPADPDAALPFGRRCWEGFKYGCYRILAWWIRTWPRPFAYWVGSRICDVAYFLNGRARHAVEANLRVVYEARGVELSERLLRNVTRKTFQNFGKYVADFICIGPLTPRLIRKYVSIRGGEHYRAIRDEPRGVILLTAHVGNWELGGALVAALGRTLNVVIRPIAFPTVERIYDNFRQRRGMRPIPLRHAAADILRALRRQDAVAFVGDRDFTHDGVETQFFGRPTPMPRGPAWFAWKTKTPIYLGFVRREPGDSYTVRFLPPIRPEDATSEQDIRQRTAAAIEEAIWSDPTQWFVFDHFWPPPAHE